ncbi:MAG: hypothetical protein QM778_28455 [Myxococcales bacterium]
MQRASRTCALLIAGTALSSNGAGCDSSGTSGLCYEFCSGDGTCHLECGLHCVPGSLGCNCGDGNTCAQEEGAAPVQCVANRCMESSVDMSSGPECSTPCTHDLTTDHGTLLHCDQGRIDGCVGGGVCVAGACTAADAGVVRDTGVHAQMDAGSKADSGMDLDAPEAGVADAGSEPECEDLLDCPETEICDRGHCVRTEGLYVWAADGEGPQTPHLLLWAPQYRQNDPPTLSTLGD